MPLIIATSLARTFLVSFNELFLPIVTLELDEGYDSSWWVLFAILLHLKQLLLCIILEDINFHLIIFSIFSVLLFQSVKSFLILEEIWDVDHVLEPAILWESKIYIHNGVLVVIKGAILGTMKVLILPFKDIIHPAPQRSFQFPHTLMSRECLQLNCKILSCDWGLIHFIGCCHLEHF